MPWCGFRDSQEQTLVPCLPVTTRSRCTCGNKWQSFQIDEISLNSVFKVIKDEKFNYIKLIQIPLNTGDKMGFTRKLKVSNGKVHMKLFARNAQINSLFGLRDQCNWKERNTVPDPNLDRYQCLISDKDKHTYIEAKSIFNKCYWKDMKSTCSKMKLDPYLSICTKTNKLKALMHDHKLMQRRKTLQNVCIG